jgi:hypothetical protein
MIRHVVIYRINFYIFIFIKFLQFVIDNLSSKQLNSSYYLLIAFGRNVSKIYWVLSCFKFYFVSQVNILYFVLFN